MWYLLIILMYNPPVVVGPFPSHAQCAQAFVEYRYKWTDVKQIACIKE